MEIFYYQINVRTLSAEIDFIKKLSNQKDCFTIGFEITNNIISNLLNLNIDSQHGFDKNLNLTCLEEVIIKQNEIIKKINSHKKIYFFFLKSDLDSIAAASILDLLLSNVSITNDIIEKRIISISNYDRHGRIWSNKEKETEDYIIPRGLFMMISGWKNSLENKIYCMKEWLMTGTFQNINIYNEMADKNLKKTKNNSKIEILIPDKLIFVKSNMRGACGVGYNFCPIVIAMNSSFRFGIDEKRIYGRKWAIAQYENSFIPMDVLLEEILLIESGWGGSKGIIGSPQDKPSKIKKEDMIKIVVPFVENYFHSIIGDKKHEW